MLFKVSLTFMETTTQTTCMLSTASKELCPLNKALDNIIACHHGYCAFYDLN